MLDENEHSRKEDGRSLHRLLHKAEQQDATVVVDSAAFFSELPPEQAAPPRRPQQNTPRSTAGGENGAYLPPKRGKILLTVQAILSVLVLVQLWRTQMLPVLYLVVLAALLALLWLLVKRCQEYKTAGTVSRVFSVVLCAAMAMGCVWAQQGLAALGNMTNGFLSNAEANKITKEPFVVYLSGVDTRGDLTDKARSDVNIIAAVNPVTKQVVLINTPRDYYVDLAGTNSKDKLTHAGLYGVQTSMDTLGNLYGVDVQHYIRINFAGFINVIDALGGVDVYSDQAFTSVGSPGYYDPTTFVEGWNHLDGKAALAFARERHAFKTGDVQRGINQMKVIDAMLNKIKSPALLMGFTKILDAVSDSFVTSLSQNQISALVRMQLSDFAEWNIERYTVTGSSGSSTKCYSAKGQKLYVMKPDENSVAKAKEMIAAVLGGEGTVSSTTQTPEKTDVYTPTTDPDAAVSVPETPADSVIVEEPAESVPEQPAEQPAEQPTEQPAETPAEQPAATETPQPETTPAEGGSTETPAVRSTHAGAGRAGRRLAVQRCLHRAGRHPWRRWELSSPFCVKRHPGKIRRFSRDAI